LTSFGSFTICLDLAFFSHKLEAGRRLKILGGVGAVQASDETDLSMLHSRQSPASSSHVIAMGCTKFQTIFRLSPESPYLACACDHAVTGFRHNVQGDHNPSGSNAAAIMNLETNGGRSSCFQTRYARGPFRPPFALRRDYTGLLTRF
jgi:hypothetical protein